MRLLLILLFPIYIWAQVPPYYSSVDFSQAPENIKQQLTILITSTHTTILPYTSVSTDTWDALKQTDLDPDNINNVLLIYGFNDSDSDITNDRVRNKNLSCHSSTCNGLWVREHTYPRSLGTPNLGFDNAGSDAHNLRAIDYQRNGTRSNRKFEEPAGVNTISSYVTSSGNWYPGPEWIGDIARMMMYMYLRYPNQCLPTNVGVGSTSYSNYGDMPNIFLEWNAADPVSSYELQRNNILEQLQGNRNPFIDNPFLATIIWNGPPTTDTWNVLSVNASVAQNLKIWPTITTGIINIENAEKHRLNYSIFNSVGQEIKTGSTTDFIDISIYPKDFYLLKILDTNTHRVYKIIKM